VTLTCGDVKHLGVTFAFMAISGNVEQKALNLLENEPPLIVRLMAGATPTTYSNSSNTTAAPTTTTTSKGFDSNWTAVYASVAVVCVICFVAIIIASVKFCRCGRAARISQEVNEPRKYTGGRNVPDSVDYLEQFKQKKADDAVKRVSIFSGKKSRVNTGRLTITGIARDKRARSISSNRSESSRRSKAQKKNMHVVSVATHDYIIEGKRENESKPAINRNQRRVMDHRQEWAEWHKNENRSEANLADEGERFHGTGKDGDKSIEKIEGNESNDGSRSNNGSDDGSTDDQDGRNENDNRRENDVIGEDDENDGEDDENSGAEDNENYDKIGANDNGDSEMTISWSGDGTDVDESNYEDDDENKFLDPD